MSRKIAIWCLAVFSIVFLARPAYAGWNPSGLQGQDVLTLTEDPGEGTAWYAGTTGGEVYKYIDGGTDWSLSSNGLPGRAGVLSLAIAPLSPYTIFVGLDGAGVYKSSDGGAIWTLRGLGGLVVRDIAVDPYSSSIVFAATPDSLYRSLDGGTNWQQVVSAVISSTDIRDISFNAPDYTLSPLPTATNIIYVASADGLYRSSNGGSTWSLVDISSSGAATATLNTVAVDPQNTSVLYAATADGSMLKSDDGGNTWAFMKNGMESKNITAISFYEWNTTSLLAGTEDGKIYRTDNGGVSWYLFNSGNTTAKVNEISFITPQAAYILAATSDGVISFDNSLPDLVVTSVSGPGSIGTGLGGTVTATVKNQGQGRAGEFQIGAYLSTDATYQSGDRYVRKAVVSGLAPGEEKTVQLDFMMPYNWKGSRYYIVYVDHFKVVAESTEDNNWGAGNQVEVLPPDLVVTSVSGPGSLDPGNTGMFSITVKNQGGGNSGELYVSSYISYDSIFDRNDSRRGLAFIPFLAAGAEKTFTQDITIPYNRVGKQYLLVATDYEYYNYGRRIVESNESNNIYSKTVIIGNLIPVAIAGGDQVVEATGPYGALVLLDGSGSTDADGDALTYTWTGSFGTATGLTPSVQLGLGSHTITLKVDDGKGGTDTDTLVITVVDTTAPVITIQGAQDGAQYALGQVPVASYTATDSGSGLAALSDSLTGGDGLGLGVFTYSVTAEDTAGNIATASVTYEVIATIRGLKALIEQMIADGLVAPQMKASMFAKINNGSDGSLSALINQIEAQRGKKISDEAADILINAIQYMIDNN